MDNTVWHKNVIMDVEIIKSIQESIKILNDHSGELAIDVAILKLQMGTMVWWFRAIVGAFIVMIVGQFWQVVVLRKNNKK